MNYEQKKRSAKGNAISCVVSTAVRVMFLSLMMLSAFACSKEEAGEDPKPVTETEPKQYDTPFQNVPATNDVIMYEVNLWAFSQTANLEGVQQRLDELKALGVNVIWLMPIYTPGELKSVGSPYAVKNYQEVNPAFGNLEKLRTLVKEAHSRDMAVMLDWVANHTSWDNAWIKNPDWYTRDGNGNIMSPAGTNWTDVADLNYGSTAMRKAMIKAMKYWILEANVDGFRCDYADGVPVDFWKQAIDTLRSIPNRDIIMFAEGRKTELYSAGFNLIFGWDFYSKLKDVYNNNASAATLTTVNASDNTASPDGKEVLRWITNHDDNAWDNSPVVIFNGQDGALAAFVVASYMGGVPLVYNGQEVGNASKLPFFNNSNVKIDWTQNADTKNAYSKLLNFRKSSDAVKSGTIESVSSSNVVAFTRSSGTQKVLVLVNVRNAINEFQFSQELANSTWTNAMTDEATTLGSSISLQPYSYYIFRK